MIVIKHYTDHGRPVVLEIDKRQALTQLGAYYVDPMRMLDAASPEHPLDTGHARYWIKREMTA